MQHRIDHKLWLAFTPVWGAPVWVGGCVGGCTHRCRWGTPTTHLPPSGTAAAPSAGPEEGTPLASQPGCAACRGQPHLTCSRCGWDSSAQGSWLPHPAAHAGSGSGGGRAARPAWPCPPLRACAAACLLALWQPRGSALPVLPLCGSWLGRQLGASPLAPGGRPPGWARRLAGLGLGARKLAGLAAADRPAACSLLWPGCYN